MKSLKILSWNTFLMPNLTQPTPEHNLRAEMIGKYLATLSSQYDIICLQKTFNDQRRDQIINELSKTFKHIITPLAKTEFAKLIGGFNSGLTVFSKLPLTPLIKHDFKSAAGFESLEPKGFVLFESEFNSQLFQFAVCHLQGHIQSEKNEEKARYAQILELKEGLDSFQKKNVMQIICGDFAINPNTAAYQVLREKLNIDDPSLDKNLWSTNEKMREKFPTIKNKIEGTELSDYIFLRNASDIEKKLIQRSSIKNATGNWIKLLNPESEFYSYKTPMTATIEFDPIKNNSSVNRPSSHEVKDYSTEIKYSTYLNFFSETPERTYNKFVQPPVSSNGIDYGIKELKKIVEDAYQNKKNCRAVGSGHSFSLVATLRSSSKNNGSYLVDMGGGINDVLRRASTGINGLQKIEKSNERLNPSWVQKNIKEKHDLFDIGAGITIKELNEKLDHQGYGLINMGTYNGQTFAGASSNSTHGSGIDLGPLPDMIRSMVLVTLDSAGTPKAYRIEPTNGPTNPSWMKNQKDIDELIQNDDLFYSAICSMGSFGLIQSYMIEVRPLYYLEQETEVRTWSDIEKLGFEKLKNEIESVRHFEFIVAPYKEKDVFLNVNFKDEIAVLQIKRKITTSTSPQGHKRSCFLSLMENLFATFTDENEAYGKTYNSNFATDKPTVPGVSIKGDNFPSKMKSLSSKTPYIDKYYNVFKQGGHAIGGYAIEITAPFEKTFEIMKKIHTICESNREKGFTHSGPIGVRFVNSSKAFMSQFYNRRSVTFEVTMLRGTPNGDVALKNIQTQLMTDPDVRMHWGLTLTDLKDNLNPSYWQKHFPEFKKWNLAYKKFNSHGVFSNNFTEWMGLD